MLNNLQIILYNYPYIISFFMIIVGLYIILLDKNLIKKIIGLNLLQGGVIVFYILIAGIKKSVPPIYQEGANEIYSNPLPHVLMLTAVVVGISTTAVACALVYRIYKNYGTIDEERIKRENNIDNNKIDSKDNI